MLQSKEQVLVSEIAKIRRQSAEEQYKQQTREAKSTPTEEEEQSSASPFFEEDNTIYNKERAIIQFILRNGEKALLVPEDPASNTPSFTESIISNMHYSITGDGIEFSHPLYKKIFPKDSHSITKHSISKYDKY